MTAAGVPLAVAVRLAEPLPTPTTPEDLDPLSVSPGLVGFLATFAVAVATVLIILDMVRRLRRLRYREEQARLAEEQERRTDEARAADGQDPVRDAEDQHPDDRPPPLVT